MASVADRVELELTRIFMKGLHLIGSVCYCPTTRARLPRAASLLARHPELPDVLITHRVPLERVDEAFALANDARRQLEVVVEP